MIEALARSAYDENRKLALSDKVLLCVKAIQDSVRENRIAGLRQEMEALFECEHRKAAVRLALGMEEHERFLRPHDVAVKLWQTIGDYVEGYASVEETRALAKKVLEKITG